VGQIMARVSKATGIPVTPMADADAVQAAGTGKLTAIGVLGLSLSLYCTAVQCMEYSPIP
jgi:hypothetical protein